MDESILRQAKADGCTAFRSGRIYKEPLKAWLEDRGQELEAKKNLGGASLPTLQEVKLRREIVALKREELALDKARDQLIPAAEYEAALRVTVSQFRAVALALPSRAAGKIAARARAAVLLMLKAALTEKQYAKIESLIQSVPIDYADIEEELQEEVDLVQRTLQPCDFLQPEGEAE